MSLHVVAAVVTLVTLHVDSATPHPTSAFNAAPKAGVASVLDKEKFI